MKNLCILFSLIIFAGCSTPSQKFDQQYNYQQVIKQNTKTDKKYSGLNNLYQISVTHFNHKVLSLKNQKLAHLQQWPSHKVEEASQKQEEALSKSTQFLVIFYTPSLKQNDLSKGANSIWRTYLQIDNQRFQGIASMVEDNLGQLSSLVPNMNRFSKVYKVDFPIPANETAQANKLSFTITGDLGTSVLTFR